jgi:hypothetical protein
MLTINSGASADFDHLLLTIASGASTGGVITGAGELSIGAAGTNTGDFLKFMNGTISSGKTTIGPLATLYLLGTGTGTIGGDLENHGSVDWEDGSAITFASGSSVDNQKGAVFDFENSLGGTIPTFSNDGTLELGAGDTLTAGTFTQSSTGTLQSNIASATSYGALSVTGTATLDGTLQGQLENGYQPPKGTNFKVLTFGSRSGQFATVSPSGWTAQYDPSDVMLVSS